MHLLLLAQSAGDPTGGTLDWIIDKGMPALCLVIILVMGLVVKKLYSDHKDLLARLDTYQDQTKDEVKSIGDKHKDEVKQLAQETTSKVEKMMEKQLDLVERVIQMQSETNAAIKALRRSD